MNASFFLVTLLFPGYFFFHIFHAVGLLPYVPWLSLSMMVIVIFFSYTAVWAAIQKKINFERCSVLIGALVLFCAASMFSVTLLNHVFNEDKYVVETGITWSLAVILGLISMFFLGVLYRPVQSVGLGLIALLLLFLMVVASIILYDPLYRSVNLASYSAPWVDKGKFATYQGLAMSLLYFSLLIMPGFNNQLARLLVLVLCVFALYFVGARTEMVLALLCLFFFFVFRIGFFKTLILASLAVVVIVFVVAFGVFTFEVSGRYVVGAEDASFRERLVLLDSGINAILGSPVLGDYLGQVRDYSEQGAYIHNFLSVWQQYGLQAFLAYVFLCLISFYIALRDYSVIGDSPILELLFYLSMTSVVGVVFAKSVAWPMPALAWGVACSLASKRRLMDRSWRDV